MNKVPDCNQCEFLRMYDYGKRIYYCGNEKRIDDMGKLGVGYPPKTSPEWCPLSENNKQYQNEKDSDLPEAPRLEIYQETFGNLKNITNEWYKNNE